MEAGDIGRILRCLEMGTVLTLFYQKKSQRPERRTFQVKLETRQIIWSRTPEKVEGDSEYWRLGAGATLVGYLTMVDCSTMVGCPTTLG